jgi:REP element-mobilizing transposase RayT
MEMKRMAQGPYRLDQPRREIVLASLLEVCGHRKWSLLAAHVRSNHVHVVIEAAARPEGLMNTLKAYATRKLNSAGLDGLGRHRWSRHGSTRYLWNRKRVEVPIAYVAEGQGETMALYVNPAR